MRKPWPRPAAIVIGADELGSAIAVALDRAGYAVVVCDAVDPPWPRRGMAFTDAWYYGNAILDGATAVFCATVKSIPSLLERPRVIAATTWSWSGTALAMPTVPIAAPRRGVLMGLSARGAAVRSGDAIVEVDPRGDPARCFGPHARAASIAHSVIAALGAGESDAAPPPSARERDPLLAG